MRYFFRNGFASLSALELFFDGKVRAMLNFVSNIHHFHSRWSSRIYTSQSLAELKSLVLSGRVEEYHGMRSLMWKVSVNEHCSAHLL
jgi:hypothetical protein